MCLIVCFKDAGKFQGRYATLGFEDAAALDDEAGMWPTWYALTGWSAAIEHTVTELVRRAVS